VPALSYVLLIINGLAHGPAPFAVVCLAIGIVGIATLRPGD